MPSCFRLAFTVILLLCILTLLACEPHEESVTKQDSTVGVNSESKVFEDLTRKLVPNLPIESRKLLLDNLKSQFNALDNRFKLPVFGKRPQMTEGDFTDFVSHCDLGSSSAQIKFKSIKTEAVDINVAQFGKKHFGWQLNFEIVDAINSPVYLLQQQSLLSGSADTQWQNHSAFVELTNPEALQRTYIAVCDNRLVVMARAKAIPDQQQEKLELARLIDLKKIEDFLQ